MSKITHLLSFSLGIILFAAPLLSLGQDKVEEEKEKPKLELHGAVRFNYINSSWKAEQKAKGGEFGYDMIAIKPKASYKKLSLNAEYRFYSEAFGGSFLKSGWIAYHFNPKDQIQAGLVYVPFGIQQYNSNNWFFNITYYVGLEDDHDMGLKYVHEDETFEYAFAFFKNAEEMQFVGGEEHDSSRYSYDVVGRNKETNQLNGNFVWKFGGHVDHRLGVSAQAGQLYNLDTKENGNHYAFALHYEVYYHEWNFKISLNHVAHNPKNGEGLPNDRIQMGAYGVPYEVATNFNIYTLSASRKFDINWGPFEKIEAYNDFGWMQKQKKEFDSSIMNVVGFKITAGNLLTFVDYAAGYNHSWLGGNFVDDFSTGTPGAKWEARFNINVGYYF